jgi:hypothetical protein
MNRIELLNQLLQLTVWLPIEDYPNYEISICGQVRNIKTKRVLKQCINRNGYYYVKLNRNNEKFKHQRIHRVVAKTFIPNLNNENFVDHIDSNRLNNTVSNLRWVSSQQNNFNRSISSKNTSRIKGISFNKKKNKWECYICFNYKQIHLGLFDNLDDAKLARQLKAKELFGEFLNECEK